MNWMDWFMLALICALWTIGFIGAGFLDWVLMDAAPARPEPQEKPKK